MLNISKVGQAVNVLYGAKNYATGQTVIMDVYNAANSAIAGSPFTLTEVGSTGLYVGSFTPSTTGEFKIHVKEGSQYRAHADIKISNYDIESVGGDVVTIKNVVENVVYGNQALYDQLIAVEGSGFVTGGDSLTAIKDYLVNTIQASISQIQNNTRTAVSIPSQMLRPSSGQVDYKIYVNIYDTMGNMEDPDDQDSPNGRYVSVAVANESGTSRDANLQEVASWNTQYWLTRDSEGRFHCSYRVANTHDIEGLNFAFSYKESGVARAVDRASVVTTNLDVESTINNIYGEVTNVTYGLSALKTLIDGYLANGGTIETRFDTLDTVTSGISGQVATNYALLTNGTYGLSALKTLIDGINVNVGNVQTDVTDIKNRVIDIEGSGFVSTTNSLVAITNAISNLDMGTGGYIG